jgi:signal transduction histidine kinase
MVDEAGARRRSDDGAPLDDRRQATEDPGRVGGAEVADALLAYIERSPAAVAIIDGDSLTIRYANPSFDRLTESDDDSAQALKLTRALPAAAAGSVEELIDALRADGTSAIQRQIASGRSGAGVVDWSVTISRMPRRSDRAPDLVIDIRDISGERQGQRAMAELLDQVREVNARLLDASLRETDLAERANAANDAKSTFLATMSHELRTPLTAIIGYEELLVEGVFGDLTSDQRRHLGRIKVSAAHLLALIDQVLTLARLDAGQERVSMETVAVADLLEWTVTIIEPLALAKGLTFAVLLSDAEVSACTIRSDLTKVRQILVNLLGNAVKFTDRGGVELVVSRQADAVHFAIRDSGIGIAPGDVDRVFGAFWQVEQRPTRTAGGSGLGLSVSRRLARLLGGDVTISSERGVGSTFTFILPTEVTPAPGTR